VQRGIAGHCKPPSSAGPAKGPGHPLRPILDKPIERLRVLAAAGQAEANHAHPKKSGLPLLEETGTDIRSARKRQNAAALYLLPAWQRRLTTAAVAFGVSRARAQQTAPLTPDHPLTKCRALRHRVPTKS